MRRATAAALATLVLTFATARAEPRSIADCERISQPDAYNRCLAEFGPAARSGGVLRQAPAGTEKTPADAAPVLRRGGRAKPPWLAARQAEGRRRIEERSRRNGVTVERKGGRVRAIIDLKK